MNNAIDWVNQKYHKEQKPPSFKAGDTVRVHVRIKEGEKERVQVYEGVVIRIHRQSVGSSFTVRKVSYGVGVERIFSFTTPSVERVEVVSSGLVRRAKLYYLRDLSGKKARIRSRESFGNLLVSDSNPITESSPAPEVVTGGVDSSNKSEAQSKSSETK